LWVSLILEVHLLPHCFCEQKNQIEVDRWECSFGGQALQASAQQWGSLCPWGAGRGALVIIATDWSSGVHPNFTVSVVVCGHVGMCACHIGGGAPGTVLIWTKVPVRQCSRVKRCQWDNSQKCWGLTTSVASSFFTLINLGCDFVKSEFQEETSPGFQSSMGLSTRPFCTLSFPRVNTTPPSAKGLEHLQNQIKELIWFRFLWLSS